MLLRRSATLAAAALLLSGCLTGQRPTLAPPAVGGPPGTPTGDANVDLVLAKLERADQVVFTADYRITRTVGAVVTDASVTQDATRTSITIGRVRFLALGSQQTCNLDSATCEDGWKNERVSDTGATYAFYQDTAAKRLRVSNARKTGPTTATTETIAGYPAACVDVPVGVGVEQYCANDLDLVARQIVADVQIELTALSPSTTEERFSTTG